LRLLADCHDPGLQIDRHEQLAAIYHATVGLVESKNDEPGNRVF
jgi:hypothetical protein